jgi:hypothetical protein
MKNLLADVNALVGMNVRVYRNLHRKCFSVQAKNAKGNWIVMAHLNDLVLVAARFRVSECGRQRVIRDKAKNVHAFVYGRVESLQVGIIPFPLDNHGVSYNPYKAPTFVSSLDGQSVKESNRVYFYKVHTFGYLSCVAERSA